MEIQNSATSPPKLQHHHHHRHVELIRSAGGAVSAQHQALPTIPVRRSIESPLRQISIRSTRNQAQLQSRLSHNHQQFQSLPTDNDHPVLAMLVQNVQAMSDQETLIRQPVHTDTDSESFVEDSDVTPEIIVQQHKMPAPAQKPVAQQRDRTHELGGILVYDSYAKIEGSIKHVRYEEEKPTPRVDPYILFTKEEVQQNTQEMFSQPARERDFSCDLDKQYYQRLSSFLRREFKPTTYTLAVPQLHYGLIFDSRFESGNLRKAAKVNNVEYNLWLENDLNTKGHTQWYYFKVNYQSDKPAKIQFNILNLAKTYSLYKQGMKPMVFSLKTFKKQCPDFDCSNENFLKQTEYWQRGCEKITYEQNEIPRYSTTDEVELDNHSKFIQANNGHGEGVETYFTLSFHYYFEHCEDEVWFAHAVPYTYTDMQNAVKEMITGNEKIIRKEILCNSLSGYPVPLLTITQNVETFLPHNEQILLQTGLNVTFKKNFRDKYKKCMLHLIQTIEENKAKNVQKIDKEALEEELNTFWEQNQAGFLEVSKNFENFGSRLLSSLKDHGQKRAIILTARVHPGEPQSSFMLEGSLKFLLSDDPLAQELRKHFVFKVVPMLNPDGVVFGNYRCSLLGCDLNRKWQFPNKFLHPTIYYTKLMIRCIYWERRITLYCDMHGHSRKQGAFFFGCSYKNYESHGRIKNAQLRILPLLCCHKNPSFSFSGCTFRIEKAKEAAGRVVVFKEYHIMNSFTLEASFHGKVGPDGKITHLTLTDLRDIGQTLISALENYLPSHQSKLSFIGRSVLEIFYDELSKLVPPHILKREEEKMNEAQPSQPSTFKKKATLKIKESKTAVVNPKQRKTVDSDLSDQPEDFDEMIAFNDRKDCNQFELNDLEDFFKNAQKRKGEPNVGQHDAGETSSEDEMIYKKKRKHKRKKNQEAKKLPETLGVQKPSAKEDRPSKGSANQQVSTIDKKARQINMTNFFSPESNEQAQPQQKNRVMPDRKTNRLIINPQSPEYPNEVIKKFKSPSKHVDDYRGVKSFNEFTERIAKLQNATSSSHFYQGQQDFQPPRQPLAPPSYTMTPVRPPKHHHNMDSANKTGYKFTQSHQVSNHGTGALHEELSAEGIPMIQSVPMHFRSPDVRQAKLAQTNGPPKGTSRRSGLQAFHQQMMMGNSAYLSEEMIEQQRKIQQMDRDSMMGIGFHIKIKPQARPQQQSAVPIWQQKSSTHMGSQQHLEYGESDAQKEHHFAMSPKAHQKHQSPLHSGHIKFQAPPTEGPTPAQVVIGFRAHLKHKRFVPVPLPLHQQQRIEAQESNQLQPVQKGNNVTQVVHQQYQIVAEFQSPRQAAGFIQGVQQKVPQSHQRGQSLPQTREANKKV